MATAKSDQLRVLAQETDTLRGARRYQLGTGNHISELRSTSGIYVLEFASGDAYVGKAVGVLRRLGEHLNSDTHSDFASFCFAPVDPELHDDVEKRTIAACESAGIKLRNHVYASFNYKPSPLDEVASPEFLDRFSGGGANDLSGTRPDEPELHRRQEPRFAKLDRNARFDSIRSALSRYILECIPAPAKTELGYWSISCLPQRGSGRLLVCLNVYWQEVLFMGEDDEGVWVRMNLAASPLIAAEQLGTDEVSKHGYVAGGADQYPVQFRLEEFRAFLAEPGVITAARVLNVRLMRKGRCNFGRSHCLPLADVLMRTDGRIIESVSRYHIDALVSYCAANKLGFIIPPEGTTNGEPLTLDATGPEGARAIGKVLLEENARSLAARYGERDTRTLDAASEAENYQFFAYPEELLDPGNIVGAVSYYDDQACQSDSWNMSLAAWITSGIAKSAAYHLLQDLSATRLEPVPGRIGCNPGRPTLD